MRSIRSRAPAASSALTRRVMLANVGRPTAIETLLQRALSRAGMRFLKNAQVDPAIRCKADVVFRKARVCVFVDGCFWHGCKDHFRVPKTNTAWWREKIADNRQRDKRQSRKLRALGWTVLRVWEHQITGDDLRGIVDRVSTAIRRKLSERP
jgi:DNA mismatch endonuclease (patch repair protein)